MSGGFLSTSDNFTNGSVNVNDGILLLNPMVRVIHFTDHVSMTTFIVMVANVNYFEHNIISMSYLIKGLGEFLAQLSRAGD